MVVVWIYELGMNATDGRIEEEGDYPHKRIQIASVYFYEVGSWLLPCVRPTQSGGRVEEGHGVVCFDWLKTYHIVYRLMCQKRLRLSPDVFAIWA